MQALAKRIAVAMVLMLTIAGSAMAQTLTNGLVGYWPMDNTQGTTLTDHTSTVNDGTFVLGSPTWVTGKFGNALEVYMTSLDRATIPHHASYIASNTYSMSFWFYPISNYRKDPFSKGDFSLGYINGVSRMAWRKFGTPWTQTSLGIIHNAQAWSHIVAVYDPTAANTNMVKQVYVDGVLTVSNSTVGVGSDTALNTDPISFNNSSINSMGSARYDDVAIWDRALTTTEIDYLYNGGTGNIAAELNALPTAPTNVAAFASDTLIILSWATNIVDPDAYAYNVYRDTSSGGPYTRVASNLTVALCVDTNLVNGTPYYYVIRSVDLRGGESADSAEVTETPVADSTPPAVPSGFSVSGGYARAHLSWSANGEPDLAGYNIYMSLSGGGPFVLQQALEASPSWTHQGLTNDVTYYYRIASEDYAGNESAQSSVVSATPTVFQDTNPGLVGYWALDETSGTNLVDGSTNTNNGYFSGGTPTWTPGKLGNALTLDCLAGGTTESATIDHIVAYTNTGVFSMAFWFQSLLGYRANDQFSKGTGSGGVALTSQNGAAKWGNFGSAPWSGPLIGFNYGDGLWHYIIVIYDPSVTYGKLVYVDSTLIASNTASAGGLDAALNASPIILKAPTSSSNSRSNRFDDVAIWNIALSPDQIQSLWNEGVGRVAYTPPPAGAMIFIIR